MSASPDAAGAAVDVDGILADARRRVAAATSSDELRQVETDVLGKRSALSSAHRALGALDEQARRVVGASLHDARGEIEALVAEAKEGLARVERAARLAADRLDLTESPPVFGRGRLHLVTRTRDELEDVFVGMGFTVAEGPEVETDWYNFEALNIPPAHPARGMFDTLYLDLADSDSVVLRTHTSPVQIRVMQSQAPPVYSVMPGRCYRRDTPDARHIPIFHQVEGLVIDRGISFADLAGTIETFTTAYFGADIHSRLRPAYFPFTEPSAEYEITGTICRGEGCRTCSQTGWIELGGCGMVDPAVLAVVGIDDEEWSGFAFGFGIDRCAQMRHQIADMRALVENDLRFLCQF
jgi:phenylalanyl-tRNA synthetase alpha chain